MRFLMLNWRDPRHPLAGGAERVSLAYLQGLVQRGHDVSWFANHFPGASDTEVVDGIHVARGGGKFTAWLAARRWARQQQPFDLVIDQHHGIPWYAPWWSNARCVAYIHEVLGPIWGSFFPWPVSTVGRLQERWTLRRYRRVPFWAGCDFTCDALKALGVETVHQISYGIDTSALEELDDKLLEEPLRLITVSRLAPNKRIDHALAALHILREDHGIKAELDIVGDGQEEPSLRRRAGELGLEDMVQFRGALDEEEKDDALRRAHFLVHTSVREGWGLNVTEANAMGTPAVVYPVPGLEESTWHGKTGWVTKTETPQAIAAALAEALRQPDGYQHWRVAARDRARELHWDNVLPDACDWLEAMARGEA